MGKKAIIFLSALLYDFIVVTILLLFIPLSFLTEKTNSYRRSRSAFINLYHTLKKYKGETVVFYCSSVGEFEQATPLIKRFEKDKNKVIIFFHSQNGLNHCKAISASTAFLSPYDLFIFWIILFNKIKPKLFIINRNEFWPGFILAAAFYSKLIVINYIVKNKITVFHRYIIFLCDHVFSTNRHFLSTKKISFSGDTRSDRLKEKYILKKSEIASYSGIIRKNLAPGKKLVIIGNCYKEDLTILSKVNTHLYNDYRFLIIPCRKGIKDLTYSIKRTDDPSFLNWTSDNVIVLNTVGNLFELYASADIAWIGGAFSGGIHNCLEAAFYGKPLISGPNLNQQPDALTYRGSGDLCIFENETSLEVLLTNFKFDKQLSTKTIADYSPADHIYTLLNESNNPS